MIFSTSSSETGWYDENVSMDGFNVEARSKERCGASDCNVSRVESRNEIYTLIHSSD